MFEIIAKGGMVMVPLIMCSVISVAIIIERALFWAGQRKGHGSDKLLKMAAEGSFDDLIAVAGQSVAAADRVILNGVMNRNSSVALAMESAAMAEIARMKRFLPALDTIITLSPLLGLLGTIIGMIRSFDILSVAGIGQPHAVTGGVAEALIATAAGLAVAIISLVPYNYFLSKADKATEEIEEYATRLEMILKR